MERNEDTGRAVRQAETQEDSLTCLSGAGCGGYAVMRSGKVVRVGDLRRSGLVAVCEETFEDCGAKFPTTEDAD